MSDHQNTSKKNVQVTAESVQISIAIDPGSICKIETAGKIKLLISSPKMQFSLALSSSSYQKALDRIALLGIENCSIVVKGCLTSFGKLEAAGLLVQPKKQRTG